MTSAPRVLLVIADSSRSGGPEHVLTLARALRDLGCAVRVMSPPGDLVSRCQEQGIGTALLPSGAAALALAPAWIRRQARVFGAQLVHSHGLRAGSMVRRAHAAAVQLHTHHLDGWFTTSGARMAAHRWELRATSRACRLQIAVSDSVRSFLVDQVGLESSGLRVVHNGIHPLPAWRRQGPVGSTVGVLARLTRSKGFDLAVLALGVPAGRGLRLRVGGSGPELTNLVDLADLTGVGSRVDFVGQVTDRAAFFSDCDLCWVPSRAEPFGLVAVEAMSSGLPVVATRVGGLPEILEPPRYGLAVAPANPAALASVSQALLADPERYRQLSRVGPERVASHFTAELMGRRTLALYREALAGGS